MNDHAPPSRGKAGWTMEDAIRYTEVQYLNLNYLLTIQVGLKHDPWPLAVPFTSTLPQRRRSLQ